VYSRAPVSKLELLEVLKKRFGLQCEIGDANIGTSPTGNKKEYYSKNHHAETFGFEPAYTSLGGIEKEIEAML
jgi:hypothetical protein